MLKKFTAEYDSDWDDCEIHEETVTVESLISELDEFDLQKLGLIRVENGKKLNDTAIHTLKRYGWVNVVNALNREQEKAFEQVYFLLSKEGYLGRYPEFVEIDLDKLPYNGIEKLVNGGVIVQEVSLKSVLSNSDYNRYLKQKEAKEQKLAKQKIANEKRKQTKIDKEIKKARKLLEQAGEL